jgi:CRP/FNR family transcriptional regulator
MLEVSVKSGNFLSGLPNRLSSLLFAKAKVRRLAVGETLFNAGDAGDGCYRLDRGVLKVDMYSRRGEKLTLAIIGPGSIVGELAIIDGHSRSASIIAVKDCELSFIGRAYFEECIKQHPEINRYLVNVLAERLRDADEAAAAASFLPVKARVARALLELTKHLGEDAGAGRILIRHKVGHYDLAAMAGVARENVSRVLTQWKREKVVTQLPPFYRVNRAALEDELES